MSRGEDNFIDDLPAHYNTPGLLTMGQTAYAEIYAPGFGDDHDWFLTYLEGGQLYYLDIKDHWLFGQRGTRSLENLMVDVRDSSGNIVDNISYEGGFLGVDNDGYYWIDAYGNVGISIRDTHYGLRIDPLFTMDDDLDGDWEFAQALLPSQEIITALEYPLDSDCFTFDVRGNARYIWFVEDDAHSVDVILSKSFGFLFIDYDYFELGSGANPARGEGGSILVDRDDTFFLTVDRAAADAGAQGNYNILFEQAISTTNALQLGTRGGDVLAGSAAADEIWGWHGDDHLRGNGGSDILIGNAGGDLLDGGVEADRMEGRGGDDIYVVDIWNAITADQVIEAVNAGIDTVLSSSSSYTLPDNVENLDLIEGSAFHGTGNNLSNTINGNSANNQIDGRAGADRMAGGRGDDIYIVDHFISTRSRDIVIEQIGAGTDTVRSSLDSYTLPDHVENLVLTGSNATIMVQGIGNELANIITGTRQRNNLQGLGGNDALKGLGGADMLDGGVGADRLYGGRGGDTFVVENVRDRIFETSATDGIDRVLASVTYSLAVAHLENLTLTGSAAIDGAGNGLRNKLIGNGAANFLDGGAGSDTLTGGGGRDGFVFSTALGASNVDRISDFSAADDTIRLDRAIFTGLAAGTLAADAFRARASAADAEDRILYDQASGRLFYDSDGTGAAAKLLFATVTPGTALTRADFFAFPSPIASAAARTEPVPLDGLLFTDPRPEPPFHQADWQMV